MKSLEFNLTEAPALAPADLLFDQYQRYAVVADVVRRLSPDGTAPILELGANTHGGLSRFFLDRRLVLLDRELAEGTAAPPNFVLGDAANLTFAEGDFEFVVSCDVFEHIPSSARDHFLRESFRVGSRGAVHAFPVATPDNLAAEGAANQIWRKFFGENFRWLEEHQQDGLPDLDQSIESARSIAPHVVSFSGSSLGLWLPLMKLHFLKEAERDLAPVVRALDRYYNEQLFQGDCAEPCYRRFLVLLKDGADAERLRGWLRERLSLTSRSTETMLEELAAAAERMVVSRRAEHRVLAERDSQIDALNRLAAQRDSWVARLDQAVAQRDQQIATQLKGLEQGSLQRDQEIARLRQQVADLQKEASHLVQSHSWRVTKPIRAVRHQYQRAQSKWQNARHLLKPPADPALEPLKVPTNRNDYAEWVRRYDTMTDALRTKMRERIVGFAHQPIISVVMPTYNTKPQWLKEAVESVRSQLYSKWELCIADDASTDSTTRVVLDRYSRIDSRIKVVYRENNGHISATSNSALAVATGEYVALLDHDDRLPEHALFWAVDAINRHPGAGLIYSDEDKVDNSNRRIDPYFKCDWNYDLFLTYNLISHLGVYKRELVSQLGGFREGFEGSQDYDLALRCIEQLRPDQIVHIPRVLYHWRVHPGSTSHALEAKPYALLAGERALNEHLARRGVDAEAEAQPLGFVRVRYRLPAHPPRVTLIVPTRNALRLVRSCVNSILEKTTYPNYDILIVDNGSDDPGVLVYFERLQAASRVRILRDDRPFNYSALNNRAVAEADGELIGLVNNDIEVINGDWLSEMVSVALQPSVGAVGARLWYPNDTLQHGGVILGVGGVANHNHLRLPRASTGYFHRAGVLQSLSAVTAACLVIRKSLFLEVGGLDEEHLKVAFNDVDFCLRVLKAGYRNVWTPFAELYHHESATRGYENTPEKQDRFAREVMTMQRRWHDLLQRDPAYSPNLTLEHEDFSYAWPPRVPRL